MTTVTQSTWNRRKLAFAEAVGVDVCQATGIEREGAKPTSTPRSAGAADDDAPTVDDKTLPLALEGGSMHRELTPQAAWPFPKKRKDEAPAAQSQTDDAASPLSEAAS